MDAGKVRQGWTMLGAEQIKLVGVPREYTIMGNQNTTMMVVHCLFRELEKQCKQAMRCQCFLIFSKK